jgi:SAM-dependent methyltransferase
MEIYKDYFQTKGQFSGFEDLLTDPEFSKAFGDERERNVTPVVKFLMSQLGNHSDRCFLDVGAGYGSLSLPLAQSMNSGVATDILEYSLNAIRFRAQKNFIRNLSVIKIDAFNDVSLPFQSSIFDLVLLNGVIEYAGLSRSIKPERVQEALFKEVRRVLKQGGLFYLSTENRFAANYFAFGKGHDGLYFSSLLPRFLADIYSKALKGEGYYMREFSYLRLKKTLVRCGFQKVVFYCGVRSYNRPKKIMRLDDRKELIEAARPFIKRRVGRIGLTLLVYLRLQKLFWPHFIVLCEK